MHALLRLLLAGAALLAAMPAVAGDPCPSLRLQATAADVPTRIAAIACAENHAWYRSFIDADGRAGGQAVYEAENDTLAGGVQAWRKVASYWNGSGLPGSCASTGPACRALWSTRRAGGLAWLVGGNVQQAVTLRMLRLDAQGRLSDLPLRGAGEAACSPDAPASCNLNRQDWAALLKLQPAMTPAPASLLAANAP